MVGLITEPAVVNISGIILQHFPMLLRSELRTEGGELNFLYVT
jgi:hypothetical protein